MAEFKVPKIPPLPPKPDFVKQLSSKPPKKPRSSMRFTKLEGAALIIGTALALPGFGGFDPVVFLTCIALSWLAFLYICFVHDGSRWIRAAIALAITLIFSFVVIRHYFPFNQKRGLALSIIEYRYEQDTQELVAKIQLNNSDDVSRTVMGVVHIYRTKDMPDNEWKVLANSADIYGDSPISVDPKKPVVATFRRRIDDHLAREDGTVFGLSLHTLSANGRSNYADVAAMTMEEMKSIGGFGQRGKRVEGISLDQPWNEKAKANKHVAVHTLSLPRPISELSTSAPPQSATPQIEKLRWVTEQVPSQNEKFPYGLAVTIQTNVTICPTHIRLQCNGVIGEAKFRLGNVGGKTGVLETVDGNTYDLSFQSPAFTPQQPLTIKVFSATKIEVENVEDRN